MTKRRALLAALGLLALYAAVQATANRLFMPL